MTDTTLLQQQKCHTPFPWSVEYDENGDACLVVGEDGTLVAHCYPESPLDLGLPSEVEYQANRELILAIPGMLECLELALRFLREDEYPEFRERLRTLITELTGEEP